MQRESSRQAPAGESQVRAGPQKRIHLEYGPESGPAAKKSKIVESVPEEPLQKDLFDPLMLALGQAPGGEGSGDVFRQARCGEGSGDVFRQARCGEGSGDVFRQARCGEGSGDVFRQAPCGEGSGDVFGQAPCGEVSCDVMFSPVSIGEGSGNVMFRRAFATAFVAAAAALHAFGRKVKHEDVATEPMSGSKPVADTFTVEEAKGPAGPFLPTFQNLEVTQLVHSPQEMGLVGSLDDPLQERELVGSLDGCLADEPGPVTALVGLLDDCLADEPDLVTAARHSTVLTLQPTAEWQRKSGSMPTVESGSEWELPGQSKTVEAKLEQRWIVDSSVVLPKCERKLPVRCRPYPRDGTVDEIFEWKREMRKISDKAAEDPLNNIPILRMSEDSDTADALISLKDKDMIQRVANGIVYVCSTADGKRTVHCTGIVMGSFKANERATVLTCSQSVCHENGKLADCKYIIRLPDQTTLEGKLLCFNHFYGFAILEVQADVPLCGPLFAAGPKCGDEVFVLSRNETSLLSTRSGTVLWYDQSYLDRNFYMFLSCKLAQCSTGGPVLNMDGQVMGMAFHLATKYPAVLPISIIVKCMKMFSKFSCVALPWHGLRLRTVGRLNMRCRDDTLSRYKIDSGYLIDKVSSDSNAEKSGIRRGDVITSFDGMSTQTLQQLEHHLLSFGWEFLEMKMKNGLAAMVYLEIRVFNLHEHSERTIRLPVAFSCFPAVTTIGGDGTSVGQVAGAAEPEITVQGQVAQVNLAQQQADAWVTAQLDRAVQFVNLT